MKKFIILFTALLSGVMIYGQVSLPQVTPTSPEAASLGRYGDFNLTNATGRMSYSIPIHNISAGAYSWPISLNYSYGGLILEGKPSMSGLGWNLSSYGSITKQARGLPDGHPEGYYGSQNIKSQIDAVVTDYQSDGNLNSTPWYVLNNFLSGTWDSQVDIYTLNVAGETVSFKLKRTTSGSAQVYAITKTNVIIVPTLDTTKWFEVASFDVTDAQGIKYHFDADDREEVVQDPAGNSIFWDDNTTAWMLSRVEYPAGQNVVFDYIPDTYFDFNFAASATETDLDSSTPGSSNLSVPAMDWGFAYNEEFRVSQLNRQVLKTITFPSGSMHITTYNNSGRLLISKVQVKNNHGTVVDTYDFTYQGVRDALVKIQKNGERFYDFEYFGEHTAQTIPDFVLDPTFSQNGTLPFAPYDQDHWRFYNGANNNRALHLPFDGPNYVANKLPNFSMTRLGALKRIIYPTKGYTEVSYEQNNIKEPYVPGAGDQNEPYNNSFFLRVDAKQSNNDRTATITKTFTHPVRATLYHKVRGDVQHGNSIRLSITETTGSSSNTYNGCYFTPPVFNNYYPINIANARSLMVEPDPSNTNTCPFYPNPIVKPFLEMHYEPGENCNYYPPTSDTVSQLWGCTSETTVDAFGDSGGDFWIYPGTYTFTVHVSHLSYGDLFGEIGMQWYDPAIGGSLPQYINTSVGGIRVKTIGNYDNTGEFIGATHFDYKDKFGYSTGTLTQIPTITNKFERDVRLQDGSQFSIFSNEFLLNSYTNLEATHGIPVYYTGITTHKNSSFDPTNKPNGEVEQTFYAPMEDHSYAYPRIPRIKDLTKGVPNITRIRNKDDNIVSTTTKTYTNSHHSYTNTTDNSSAHPWSFVYHPNLYNNVDHQNKCYHSSSSCEIYLKELHSIKFYKEVDIKRYLKSDNNKTDNIITNKENNYNSKDLLTETSVSTSDGKAIKTKNYYADDLGNSTLITQNRIAVPLKTETYKGNILDSNADAKLSSQNTIYAPNSGNYLPNIVQVSKGNNSLENRMEYHDYDTRGNPLEVFMEQGTHIVYIWGYNQTLPVAKIENATYTQVSSYVGHIQTLSDADDDRTIGTLGHEGSLRNALNALRNVSALSGALITTYTYDPLIGVTSVTDPDGNVVYYEYDNQNRLKQVKDKDGNILSENHYHYKN